MRDVAARWLVSFAILAFAAWVPATPTGNTFSTSENAVDAFVTALRNEDPNALRALFGKDSEPLFQSADPVADRSTRKRFLQLYDKRHALVEKTNGANVLTVGTDAWPFPIPLVKTPKGWAFDTEVGIDEIVNRRIGRNELQTIQTCLAIVAAQREYHSRDRDGDGILEFAQVLRSGVGLHNGLFWPAEKGEQPSPSGELAAAAATEGYTPAAAAYHGYHYRMLHAQGAAAPGGAYDYLAHDNQIGGFAILAYPAAYGDSGVMTFIVNHDGIVYQRDLGLQTETEAMKISKFDPGEGWIRVPDKDLAPIPEE